ncbi:MAG: ABC transporter ATP-binding protein, partial [Gammaproteobacteria bacterium]|nr:ABC transporter ATP-binding protein [Gammaproteobacteria bacterium]
TNHLDLEVRHALTMAIQQFEGAVILVSHDQYLLNNSVDEFYLVNQGVVKPYDGSLPEYLAWLRSSASGDTTATKPATSNDKKKQRQDAANLRAAQAPIRKRIKQIDTALEKANQQKESLEEVLADTQLYTTDPDRVASVSKQYSEIKDEIEMLELEWLELSEQLEA